MEEIGKSDLLDTKGACEYLKVSIATLYRLLKRRGGIPAHRIAGSWRFIKSELDQWVKDH